MKSKMLCVCAGIATFVFAAGEQYAFADNRYIDGPEFDDPAIVVDAGWFPSIETPPAFTWADFTISGLPVFNREGPYTWESATRTALSITDDFCTGDQFRIYDWGVPIGDTSVPGVSGSCSSVGPVAAFEDPIYSSGSFLLGPGAHSITIQVIVKPLNFGRGYIKVDSAPFTAKELKVAAADALVEIGHNLPPDDPGTFPKFYLFAAADQIQVNLDAFEPGEDNQLVVDLGRDAFDVEENAVDNIFKAVQSGKIVDEDILAGLRAVIGKLHEADDILAQAAIDDATEDASTNPKDLDFANSDLDRARDDADNCVVLPYDPVGDGVKGNQTEPEGSSCDNAILFYYNSWNRVN